MITDEWLVEHSEDRAEDWVSLRIGTILRDEHGYDQVFIGWRHNTAGHEMVFSEIYRKNGPVKPWHICEPRHYHASMLGTLCRKFPTLRKYIKISLHLRREQPRPTMG